MRINKNIIIAFSTIILSLIIGWLASPYLIESYFNNQPIYSISESKSKLVFNKNMVNENNIPLGQSIVLQGTWINDYVPLLINNGFTADGNSYNDSIQLEPVINRINCIPFESGNYKVVGAYNSDSDRILKFYVVWILGGCN